MHPFSCNLFSRVCAAAALLAGLVTPMHAVDPALLDQLVDLDYKFETGRLKHAMLASMRSQADASAWEPGLLEVLTNPEASTDGRLLAAELLKQCLRAENADVLLPLLTDNRVAHAVRDLLAPYPDAAIDASLVEALPKAVGRHRSALLSTLAERRSAAAVPAILELLDSETDPDTVAIALRALGRIGGTPAARFFLDHKHWLGQPAWLAHAYAEGAVQFLAHEGASAWMGAKAFQKWVDALLQLAPDEAVKLAAYRALQQTDPKDYRRFVEWMRSDSEMLRLRAAAVIPLLDRSAKLKGVLRDQLGSWSAHAQLLVLEGWLETGDRFALELARGRFDPDSGQVTVNRSCLRTFAAIGELADAKRLLPIALGESDLADAAAESLAMLPDGAVNPWLMQRFADGDEIMQDGILQLVVARGMREELAGLLAEANQHPRALQRSIYRAIGSIGDLEMVDELMRQRQVESPSQNDIERAIVDIGRRFPTPVVSERLIADWKAADGAEKDRLLRMIGAIDQPNSIELLGDLILEPEPNALALRSINAMDAFEAFAPLERFLKRDDVPLQDRKASWRAVFRITRRAMETWRDDRNDFWVTAHACAPGTDEVGVMIAYTTEAMRGEFVPWLEALSVPELEVQRMDALQTLKKEFGLE